LDHLERLVRHNSGENLFEPIVDAVKAKATLQEIIDAMRKGANFIIPR
jgi:methylmalonyl-CoA mutase N-terminal domain/subunit